MRQLSTKLAKRAANQAEEEKEEEEEEGENLRASRIQHLLAFRNVTTLTGNFRVPLIFLPNRREQRNGQKRP